VGNIFGINIENDWMILSKEKSLREYLYAAVPISLEIG
jgi:hypothetical protein